MIAFTAGAFADAARLTERAAGLARAGGDLADASLELGLAAGGYLVVGDASMAVPLAREALTLARQIGDPALIASGLLAVGMTVAENDPEQARAYLRESLELSTALGYQGALDHARAAGIAFLVNDRTATLELGRSAIRALQPGGDRIRISFLLDTIAGALAATQPEAAAIIQGAARTYGAEPPNYVRPISLIVTETRGEPKPSTSSNPRPSHERDRPGAGPTWPAQAPLGGSGWRPSMVLPQRTRTIDGLSQMVGPTRWWSRRRTTCTSL